MLVKRLGGAILDQIDHVLIDFFLIFFLKRTCDCGLFWIT